MGRTVMFSWEPIFIASGAIMGMRVCISILIGSIVCWMVFVPALQHAGLITSTAAFATACNGRCGRACRAWSLPAC